MHKGPVACVIACVLLLSSCASEERRTLYRAEKMLFQADRMKSLASDAMIPAHSESLDRAIDAYRDIVARFRDVDGDGVEAVVLAAQLGLARLELDTDRVAQARSDFLAVLDIEHKVPDARMDALFNAARISERMREPERAFELYEKFYVDYLSMEQAATTARKDPDYLDTPLKLAALCGGADRGDEQALWQQAAEALYEHLISTGTEPDVMRAARFNLLTARVERAEWDRALELSRSLTVTYRDDDSRTAVLLMEARIHDAGKQDAHTAADLYRHIYEQYPASVEAPGAMLAHAALLASRRDTAAAEQLYGHVVRTYSGKPEIASRAEWQLALMDEARGNWVDASLRYKSIPRRYPATQAAFDAPLRLADGYVRIGAQDAAAGAYERALEEYRKIARGRYPVLSRLMADEYIQRVLTVQGRWEEAVRHLVDVADRYPAFERTHYNYITAAEICSKELGNDRHATEVLVDCIEKFPGSGAAREAQRRLALMEERG